MSKKTDILLIDDEQVILDFGEKIASFLGYSIDTAPDAETGLEKVRKNNYRLIVSDIKLPGIDGISLLEKIRTNGIKTPVIMTTGYSTFENAVLSLNKGALDFISKPFTADEIISALQRGFKFVNITESNKNNMVSENEFVPCPSRFSRLGFYSWVHGSEEGTYLIGVADIFLKIIDGFQQTGLKDAGEELEQGKAMVRFQVDESVYHDVLAPLSGKIVEVNKSITDDKNIIIKDPYFEGWIYKIIPSALQKEWEQLSSCGEF